MVAVNEIDGKDKYVEWANCPGCDGHYYYPTVESKGDKFGRPLREVTGWCQQCGVGYVVRQFKKNDSMWLTYQYRKYIYRSGQGRVYVGPWSNGYRLPDPAPVVTGPGGDYVKQTEIDPDLKEVLKKSVHILKSTAESIVELMDIAKKRRKAKG